MTGESVRRAPTFPCPVPNSVDCNNSSASPLFRRPRPCGGEHQHADQEVCLASLIHDSQLIKWMFSISKIDDVNMEYRWMRLDVGWPWGIFPHFPPRSFTLSIPNPRFCSAQLTFREEWVDGRLAYGLPKDNRPDHIILTAGQQIWMPDTFFQVIAPLKADCNSISLIRTRSRLESMKSTNPTFWSESTRSVSSKLLHFCSSSFLTNLFRTVAFCTAWESRWCSHVQCFCRYFSSILFYWFYWLPRYPFQYYPMDIQTCLIDMASYAYTDTDIGLYSRKKITYF